ncbi:hypothetical protein GF325_03970 [Candidatus Bathyarchaeota archaeon]|nr:hypothetical protein [Candidatus Bathyarchaeota archaeon]
MHSHTSKPPDEISIANKARIKIDPSHRLHRAASILRGEIEQERAEIKYLAKLGSNSKDCLESMSMSTFRLKILSGELQRLMKSYQLEL